MKKFLFLNALLFTVSLSFAQRTYKPHSVLATGNWFKFKISAAGVHKIDVAFLNSLGITGSIPSAAIRIFGNGGAMLPEAAGATRTDDLEENAITVVDGGDGTLNGSDYILFFAPGPHHWLKDSVNKRFTHVQNLYANEAFYFITIGGAGLRIPNQTAQPPAAVTVTSFDERFFHELDTVNFLSSGKDWFGEEFSSAPGRMLSRTFTLPFNDLLPQPGYLVTNVVARSVNTPSRFTVAVNNQPVQQLDVPQVSTAQYDAFGQQVQRGDLFFLNGNTASIQMNYVPGSFNSQSWLNWFEFFARRPLSLTPGAQTLFRDWNSVGASAASFIISNGDASAQVWDVTDALRPVRINTSAVPGGIGFINDALRLREYVCFSGNFLLPQAVGKVAPQDLHNTTEKDYIIVSHPDLLAQARRLESFHQQRNNLRTGVVTTDQVFNEFSGGLPDPTAIRDFVKMYHDRYPPGPNAAPRSLLLLGKASFDPKSRMVNNTNLVPAYQSKSSLDPLGTYTSDDYFGFLEDHEDINSGLVINTLDIGIGRVPARTAEEARNFVDKLWAYHDSASLGPWRNSLNFVADDEDLNLHLQDAEILTATVSATAPLFNPQKIYLDAYRQESGSAGGRYPQANAVINSNIFNGTLIWNYSGHGGAQRLAEEVVIDQQTVDGWNNSNRLPLFITATCDFAPYDNPTLNSLGENLLIRPTTGAIALMTTTRVVFAYSNRILNNNYLRFAFERLPSGRYRTLGEAVAAGKNYTYQTSGDIINNRKFTLLGDPAMTLGFPVHKVVLTKVNGKDLRGVTDTLSAAELVTAEGEVTDATDNVLTGFTGTVSLSLFDKVQTVTTLGNDATSPPVSFSDRQTALFRGKASVINGKFTISFRMPKDINFQYGNGRVSLYAQNGIIDGNGLADSLVIGGISPSAVNDKEGPQIEAFLNDSKFVNGGLTNSRPVLILQLADTSGIHTGGSGIDHDIVATLDNDNDQYFVLNNFYESELDNYGRGTVRFQLPELAPGTHSLKIKAWDVVNNSSEQILEFTVANETQLKIAHVLNYPNPFTSKTAFWFEHNQPGTDLAVRVEIFTITGRLIKTISRTINSPGNRSSEIEWDGRDEFGSRIGQGVYIYRLNVRSPNGSSQGKWERLVILSK